MEQAAPADEATEGRLGMLGSQMLPIALVEVRNLRKQYGKLVQIGRAHV